MGSEMCIRDRYIDILSDELCDTSIFAYFEPEQLRVSETLIAKIRTHKSCNHVLRKDENGNSYWPDVLRAVEDELPIRR